MSIASETTGSVDIVKDLIEHGANINQKDVDGKTPLDIAIQSRESCRDIDRDHYDQIIEILLNAGAIHAPIWSFSRIFF